ncbi:MAG: hypothetical protein HY765_03975 [Rhodomicrobium sp.]|nr:hypothetical protein [Rhodomicrobium sp.]
MTGASEELFRAVYGLRKAAEAQFTGNTYCQVTNLINAMIESLGWGEGGIPPGKGAAYGFAAMLEDVRKQAEACLTGEDYRLVAHKLDELRAFLNPPPARALEALAAASEARADKAAASLGVAMVQPIAPAHAEAAETLADGELERRSSEPCAMAEPAPPVMEPLESAAIPAETAPAPNPAEAAFYLGSPAVESEDVFIEDHTADTATEAAAEPAFQPSAPAHDTPALAAGQTVDHAESLAVAAPPQNAPAFAAGQKIEVEVAEASPKQPKTLFQLWLDLAFGRKN